METYHVSKGKNVELGRQGENLVRQVRFDLSRWISSFGPGTVQLLHKRSGDETPYPAAVEQEGTWAVWTVTNADTAAAGTGSAELQYYVGDALAKSETWMTKVFPALGHASETPPEAQQGWVDQVLQAGTAAAEAADRAENAAIHQPIVGSNGNWWTWDLEAGAYTDTGIYSGGDAPFIGENGNWYVGQTDTGVAAAGPAGSIEMETANTDLKITWQFAEGMPEDKGLTYTGTEGKAVMQSDGLLLSAGAEYKPPVLTAGKSEVECVFTIQSFATGQFGFLLDLTNGITGIRISCYNSQLRFNQNTNNNTTLASLSTDTEYTLRIQWDETSGADVYLNGTAVKTGASTVYAISENRFAQTLGGTTLLKSLRYTFPGMGDEIVSIDGKKLRDETARAMAMQGGGAGGLTVTNTAAVGQTIRVSAVDENGQPTQWEAVDMYSKEEIDTALGSYINDVAALVGGDA